MFEKSLMRRRNGAMLKVVVLLFLCAVAPLREKSSSVNGQVIAQEFRLEDVRNGYVDAIPNGK